MKKIFTILAVSALAITANAQTNLVANPGFKSWDAAEGTTPAKPTGWSFVSATGVEQSSTAHTGSSSLKHIAPASGNGSTNIDIVAEANTQYSLGYWVLDNDPNARGRHWVQARKDTSSSGNITWSSPFQPSTYSSDNAAWVFVTATATTPATTTLLRFDFRTYGTGAGGGSIYYDDVTLVKGILAVADIKDFDKQVQFNTIVKDQITFKLPVKSTVNIYSVEGKLISSNRVENGGSVNTQSLVKGAYVVTVDNGANKISRKVIKN